MASSGGELIGLQVRTLATGNHDVQVPAQASVGDLKQALVRPTGLPVGRQRIIYSGRVLEDGQPLASAGIRDGHTLHLVEQDPSNQPPPQQQQQGVRLDPNAMMQAMLGGMAGPGGAGMPPMPGVSAQVLGPFDVMDVGAWQQVSQQLSATLGGLVRGAGGAPSAAPGDGARAGTAAAGNASPFNFGNLFAPPAAGRGPGPGSAGRGGGGAGGGSGAAGPRGGTMWWGASQQHMPQEDDRAHLFDGLDVLLACMEGGSADGGVGDLPHINQITEDLAGVPPQQRSAWRRSLASWQRNFVSAARNVLETAQLSGATRAAVNRVLEAADAAPLRLSASGGSRPAERRVRSFPLLFDPAAPSDAVAAAADGGAVARDGSSPPTLASSDSDETGPQLLASSDGSDSEWEEMGEEERAVQAAAEAAAAAWARPASAEAQDGAVEDCPLSGEEDEEDQEGRRYGSYPESEVMSEEDEEPPAQRRRTAGPRPPPRAARPPSPPQPLLPLGDLLLLGGVAAGELARRFLLVLGAPTALGAAAAGARGLAAEVAEAVERLRGLTEVPTAEGAARDAVTSDLRLLGVHMSRVSAAAAELMRAMQYLGSGAEHRNLYLARAQPGYLHLSGERATPTLPRPQRMQLVPAVVDVAMGPGPAVPGSGGPGLQHMLGSLLGPVVAQMQAAAAPPASAGRGRGAAGRGSAAGRGGRGQAQGPPPAAGEQVVRVQLLDGAGQPMSAAIPVGGAAGRAAAEARGEMSDEVAGMAAHLLGQLGVSPAGQQQLLGQFEGIMRALRETSVASLDVPAIGREVGAAVRQAVLSRAQPLQAALQAAAAPAGSEGAAATGTAVEGVEQQVAEFARAVVPAVTSEVQRVLQQHLARLRTSPAVAAFAPHLEELGIHLMAGQQAAPQAAPDGQQPNRDGQPGQRTAAAPPAAPDAAAAAQPSAPDAAAAAPAAFAAPTAAPDAAAAAPAAFAAPTAAPDAAAAAPPSAPDAAAAAAVEPAADAPPQAAVPAPGSVQPRQEVEEVEAGTAEAAVPAASLPCAPASPAGEAPVASPASPAEPDSSAAGGKAGGSTAGSSSGAGAPSGLGRGFLLPRKGPRPARKAAAAKPNPPAEQQAPEAETTSAAAPTAAAPLPASPAPPANTGASAPADLSLALPGGGGAAGMDLGALMRSLGGGEAGGGGGGLMGMLQGMMSSPALVEMAQSPAMQRMAEQMFSGSGADGAGGGGGLGGLVSAMGEMLGGGGFAPPASGGPGSRGARAQAPASLDEVLSCTLSPEDAARWKEAIAADDERQRQQLGAGNGQHFSDAYLAALPPKTASSLMRLGDDDGDGEEGEQQAQQQRS